MPRALIEEIQTLEDKPVTDAVREVVTAFVETQKSYEGLLAPQNIYVVNEELANELGVDHSPFCGVFTVQDGDIPCYACAGPDGLGNWNGVVENLTIHEWIYESEVQ